MRIIDGNNFEGMRMIIPEHREAMLRLQQETKKMKKPIIYQDKLEEMSRTLAESIFDGRVILVTIYKSFGNELVEMVPVKIDPYQEY